MPVDANDRLQKLHIGRVLARLLDHLDNVVQQVVADVHAKFEIVAKDGAQGQHVFGLTNNYKTALFLRGGGLSTKIQFRF